LRVIAARASVVTVAMPWLMIPAGMAFSFSPGWWLMMGLSVTGEQLAGVYQTFTRRDGTTDGRFSGWTGFWWVDEFTPIGYVHVFLDSMRMGWNFSADMMIYLPLAKIRQFHNYTSQLTQGDANLLTNLIIRDELRCPEDGNTPESSQGDANMLTNLIIRDELRGPEEGSTTPESTLSTFEVVIPMPTQHFE